MIAKIIGEVGFRVPFISHLLKCGFRYVTENRFVFPLYFAPLQQGVMDMLSWCTLAKYFRTNLASLLKSS